MKFLAITFALFFVFAACTKDNAQDEAIVFSATGDINTKLNEFRNTLGPLNTTTGQTGGRREINWDSVPDNMMGIKLPEDFFNATGAGAPAGRQRGLLYAGASDAIVSKTFFSEVNTQASGQFGNFSGDKSFAVVNAAQWPVEFRVAGTTTIAAVKAFGIVFSDVDKPESTFLEFFSGTESLGRFYAPVHDAISSFSFLGVYFPNKQITKVNVVHEGMLVSNEKDITQGGANDLVIMDDFIYSEPVAR
jgi:hypothetical protein